VDAEVERAELAVVLPLHRTDALLDPLFKFDLVDGRRVEILELAAQTKFGRLSAAHQQVGGFKTDGRFEELAQRRLGERALLFHMVNGSGRVVQGWFTQCGGSLRGSRASGRRPAGMNSVP